MTDKNANPGVGEQQQVKTYRARLDELAGLSSQARCLYLVMCKISGKDPFCWGSVEYLAMQAGLKERMARTYLREIEKAGWIKRERRGLGQTNRYWFTAPTCTNQCMDRQYIAGQDRQYIAGQDRQYIAGQDRQYIAGQDRQYIAGHTVYDLGANTKEQQQEQIPAAAEEEAPSKPEPPEKQQALARLTDLHCPKHLAEEWTNDPGLVLVAVDYLERRRNDSRLRPIRNAIGLLRAIMKKPQDCGFEWTGNAWCAPEDGLPRESPAAKQDRLARERQDALAAKAEASEVYRWRLEAQKRWDALNAEEQERLRAVVRKRWEFLQSRADDDYAVTSMCLREMEEQGK